MLTRMARLLTRMARMLTRMTRWLAYCTHSFFFQRKFYGPEQRWMFISGKKTILFCCIFLPIK